MGRPAFAQHNADRDVTREYPFSEPLIIQAVHVDGIMARAIAGSGGVNLVGWQTIEPLCDGPGERRIVARLTMSDMEARAFRWALGRSLSEGH